LAGPSSFSCAPAHVTKGALGRSLRRIKRGLDLETFGSAEADEILGRGTVRSLPLNACFVVRRRTARSAFLYHREAAARNQRISTLPGGNLQARPGAVQSAQDRLTEIGIRKVKFWETGRLGDLHLTFDDRLRAVCLRAHE